MVVGTKNILNNCVEIYELVQMDGSVHDKRSKEPGMYQIMGFDSKPPPL